MISCQIMNAIKIMNELVHQKSIRENFLMKRSEYCKHRYLLKDELFIKNNITIVFNEYFLLERYLSKDELFIKNNIIIVFTDYFLLDKCKKYSKFRRDKNIKQFLRNKESFSKIFFRANKWKRNSTDSRDTFSS